MVKYIILSLLICNICFATNTDPTVSFVSDEEYDAYDPYVCNAGIKHPAHNYQICLNRSSTSANREVCRYNSDGTMDLISGDNPGLCCKPDDHNCECTSGPGNVVDFIRYSTIPENGSSDLTYETLVGSNTDEYNMINGGGSSSSMGSIISSLYYNFESELYGATYFLDVCYPAPGYTVEYKTRFHKTDFTVTPGGYENLAQPTLKISQVDGSYPCLATPIFFPTIPNMSSDSNLVWELSGVQSCVIRFEFNETNVNNMRKWQFHNDQYIIHAKVEVKQGCTYTIGYWKQVATEGHPANTDPFLNSWITVPPAYGGINLGAAGECVGSKCTNVTEASIKFFGAPYSWYQVISNNADSLNPQCQSLGRQWIGASLNQAFEADTTEINAALTQAEIDLTQCTATNAPPTDPTLINTLSHYNEGITGPGHCDSE